MSEKLKRRNRCCDECPWRDPSVMGDFVEAYRASNSNMEAFTCHEEDGYAGFGSSMIVCRGAWEKQRKLVMDAKRRLEELNQ